MAASNLALLGVGGPATSGSFSPASMSGIQGWYDFSTLALTDGTAISTLSDGSSNGRNLSASGTAQPTCKTGANGINSLAVALFNGTSNVMTTGAFSVTQPITVYAVVTGGNSAVPRYWCSADASLSIRAGWNASGPNNYAGSTLTVAAGTTSTPKVVTSVFNGASSLIRVDGTQVTSGTVGTGNLSNGLAVGAAVSAQFWDGKIGELFWTNVSSVDTAAEAYLKAKWGTP